MVYTIAFGCCVNSRLSTNYILCVLLTGLTYIYTYILHFVYSTFLLYHILQCEILTYSGQVLKLLCVLLTYFAHILHSHFTCYIFYIFYILHLTHFTYFTFYIPYIFCVLFKAKSEQSYQKSAANKLHTFHFYIYFFIDIFHFRYSTFCISYI